jgi:hypothetical protein
LLNLACAFFFALLISFIALSRSRHFFQHNPMHTDKSIYKINFIKSLKYKFDDSDTWLSAQLSNIAQDLIQKSNAVEFADKLASVLRGHPRYGKIDRVCLAQTFAPTNELSVLSSWCSMQTGRNLMPQNYRCFVDPNGSLLQLKNGQMRVYGNSDDIIAAYHAEQRPVQRSMRYINDMGFKSGLCIPIYFHDAMRGLFFMNSMQEGFFDTPCDEDYALYSQMTMNAKIALMLWDDVVPVQMPQAFQGVEQYKSVVFAEVAFQEHLQEILYALSGRKIAVHVEYTDSRRFILSPSRVALHLASAMASLMNLDTISNIAIWLEHKSQNGSQGNLHGSVHSSVHSSVHGGTLAQSQSVIRIRFQHLLDMNSSHAQAHIELHAERLKRKAQAAGLDFAIDGFFASLSFPFDEAFGDDSSILYSV